MATHHLLSLGHRDIACIAGPDTHPDAVDRLSGFLDALQEARVPVQRDLVVDGFFSEEGGVRAVERLLKAGKHFTAIFACNDQSATGAQLALQRRGLRIPADVSVVGFDDLPTSAFVFPPLTTVRQPASLLGRSAAEAVIRKLGHEPFLQPDLGLRLMVRESTAPLLIPPEQQKTSRSPGKAGSEPGSVHARKVRTRRG